MNQKKSSSSTDILLPIKKTATGICLCGAPATKIIAGHKLCPHCGDGELVKIIYTGISHLEEVVIKTKFFTREGYEQLVGNSQHIAFEVRENRNTAQSKQKHHPDNPDRFSAATARIIEEAREQAFEFDSNCITPQHMVLAVLDTCNPMSGILSNGIERLRNRIESCLAAQAADNPFADPHQTPFTPEAKNVIEKAGSLAHSQKAGAIEVEHVIMALLDSVEEDEKEVLTLMLHELKGT